MSDAELESFFSESNDAPAYLKFEEGKTKIRILTKFVLGWEGWYNGKPVRTGPDNKFGYTETALLEKNKGRDGTEYPKYKQFAACLVWNYNLNAVQIWEFTQQSITKQIMGLKSNTDWGDITSFDITIERKGKGFDTEYNLTPSPKKDIAEEVKEALEKTRLDPNTLLTDAANIERINEIKSKAGTSQTKTESEVPEIDPDNIPF
jgi:hypothetical protein